MILVIFHLIAENNEPIKVRNLATSVGSVPVDFILKLDRDTDRYSVVTVGLANSIDEQQFEAKIKALTDSQNKDENVVISSLRKMRTESLILLLDDLFQYTDVTNLESARDEYVSPEDYLYSLKNDEELIDFIKYNDVTLLQEKRSDDLFIDKEGNIFTDLQASDDLIDSYGEEILEALIKAKEQNLLDELHIPSELEDALSEFLRYEPVYAYDIEWDIDPKEALEHLDEMTNAKAAKSLDLTEDKYASLSISERHDLALDIWKHSPSSLEEIMGLPDKVEIPTDLTNEEDISDWLSEEYGFCHDGFKLTSDHKNEIQQENLNR